MAPSNLPKRRRKIKILIKTVQLNTFYAVKCFVIVVCYVLTFDKPAFRLSPRSSLMKASFNELPKKPNAVVGSTLVVHSGDIENLAAEGIIRRTTAKMDFAM